ncbi:lipid A biosynthesis acyltransferase [Acinetobacter qingfengensis]|uniref:Lipid A biosynthesis acyltransferase n=1 Tax=Acinetobacter qingfengensis TaxID=1262585 RepID=A0A1E7RFP5_9GAMM|nr:lipid A biosynthesis acyltransferase [Acinetobacter qingfengensis]KAA8731819.1 lipid A biosynthesis acyltransferase [Acinetobacter qingfengensis]OEY98057.1 lipid A biosynthesis acyltransferase [Acinetobacter qingfengensis]
MHKQPPGLVTLIKTVSKLPIRFLQGIAKGLTYTLINLTKAKTLHAARLNLDIAFPDISAQKNEQLRKQAAINEMTAYFEFFKIWGSSTQQNIDRIHYVEGEKYLRDAIEKGHGVVLVIPHFGTWEVMNAWVSQYTPMTIMYKPLKNTAVDQFVREARSRQKANLVPTDETGVKQVFKTLKQGGTTAILPDHSPDFEGDFTNWFGIPLYSSHLIAKMVQKTKASALLLYAFRNDNGGFDMFIESLPEQIQDRQTNGTALIHEAMENLIHRYPEHYHWSYKRFKANPDLRRIYDLPYEQAITIIRKMQADNHYLSGQ